MTHLQAMQTLSGRHACKVGNNTVLHVIDADTVGVRLHNTNVVLIHRDGMFTLNSGGWQTVTTKDRINAYSPARVYSQKSVWWVGIDAKTRKEFRDGIKVDRHGNPI